MANELRPTISSPRIGLNLDADPLALEPGEYTYCLNGGIVSTNSSDPFVSNLEANKLKLLLPLGYMIVGRCKLDRNDIALMLVNMIGDSEIGIYSNGIYTKKAHDKKLGFSIRHGISVKFKSNYKGDRIIYWTDNNQPPRWMNLDHPNFIQKLSVDGCTLENTADLDLDFMKIFKDFSIPCMVITAVTEDGNLKSGGYFITGQYADAAGNGLTATFPLIGDIPIFQRSTSETSDSIVGVESEKITSKSIKIGITGADTSFTHINIIAVKVINKTVSAFKVGLVSTSATQYVYNGAGNREEAIGLDEITRSAIKYSRAKTIDTTNTQLLLGNLWSEKEFNFQPYVQKTRVQWQCFKAWSDDVAHSFKNPQFAAYMRCFRRDEVYALALVFDLIDGTSTKGWHIPGRKLNKKSDGTLFTGTVDQFGNTIDPNNWDDATVITGNDNYDSADKRYKLYNTATIEGNASTTGDTGIAEYGEMGFYESTETYDCDKNVYGEDAGKPIRHHMMPDSTILHIHDGEDGVRVLEDRVKINYLGVRLPNIDEVIASLPKHIRDKIKGWRLVVADRTYDKSVLASGIMLNAMKQDWGDMSKPIRDTRMYPNYPLNDLRPDPYVRNSDFVPGNGLSPLNNKYMKDAFFFHSPDTHFKKQFLVPGQLKINVELYGETLNYFDYVEPYPQFREKAKDNDQAAVQGYSIGWYNNYKKVPQNNTRRKLNDAFYVPFSSKVSGGSVNKPIWNVMRESSVFLSTGSEVNNPTQPDTSRSIMNDADKPPVGHGHGCTGAEVRRNTALYYSSIKNPQPNQYGNLHDLKYIDTYSCKPDYIPSNVVFGGDTYIGKFSFKTNMAFFQNVKAYIGGDDGLDGADFAPAATIDKPIYYYRNLGAGGSPRSQSFMMCEDNQGHGVFGIGGDGDATALGYLALAMYGIPIFWTESDFNIDLRHPGATSDQTFYPNLNSGAYKLKDWLNIRNVDVDNVFNYNEDFSFKNALKVIESISPFYDPLTDQDTHYNTRTVFSLKSQPEDIQDNWVRFQPLDYYDLPKNKGELIDIRYIGNYKTLFRMRDTIFMDSVYGQLESSFGKIQLGSGKLFEKEPQEILSTENGYGGTVSQFAFNNTQFGPLFPSANSRKCFGITNNLDDIGTGVKKWLHDNLPFKLSKQIQVLSEDNACNPEGIGLLSEWDKTSGLWFVTKRDYEVLDQNNIPRLKYKNEQLFLDEKQVSLQDKTLFRDCSWTFAYAPERRRWIAWESFIPNFYLVSDDDIFSGENNANTGIHIHNVEGEYQTFYGRKYPFIIECAEKADGVNTVTNPTVTFMTRAINASRRNQIITFNKAIVYNMFMCSGLLNLIIQDENNLSTLFKELKNNDTSRDVALRVREGHYNFSDFYDIFKHENNAFDFFTSQWNNIDFQKAYPIDKVLNQSTLNYNVAEDDYSLLRERWIKYRLIFDTHTDIKLLLQMAIISNIESIS